MSADARSAVLGRLRAALAGADAPPAPPRDYLTTSTHSPQQLAELFVDRVVDYGATVSRTTPAALAATLADAVAGWRKVVVADGSPEDWVPEAVRDHGQLSAAELDAVDGVVTGAAIAIAETGTIILDGSAESGRRALSLVPDRHVCVVRAEQVVGTVPEALARLDPTRPLTFVSGPSATSDIELERVQGVHGPRTLVVVLVEEE